MNLGLSRWKFRAIALLLYIVAGQGMAADCVDSPPVGDGWGWDGISSCRVANNGGGDGGASDGATSGLGCIDTDPVGDGWGWNGSTSCRVSENGSGTTSGGGGTSGSNCVDTAPVGDGWGWDGTSSCRVANNGSGTTSSGGTSGSSCVDTAPVGDGWGWDGTSSCRIAGTDSGGTTSSGGTSGSSCVDTAPVGDGWGWDGSSSCQIAGTTDTGGVTGGTSEGNCIDTDPVGDGWGWNGTSSCRVTATADDRREYVDSRSWNAPVFVCDNSRSGGSSTWFWILRESGQLSGVQSGGILLEDAGSWTQSGTVVSITNEDNELSTWSLTGSDLSVSWGFCDHIAGPALTSTPAPSPGTIEFSQSHFTVREGDSISVPIIRTGGTSGPAEVRFQIVGLTASAGVDFERAGTYGEGDPAEADDYIGRHFWLEGESRPGDLSELVIRALTDFDVEGNERLEIRLSNADRASLGSVRTATITITENQVITLAAGDDYSGVVGAGSSQLFSVTGAGSLELVTRSGDVDLIVTKGNEGICRSDNSDLTIDRCTGLDSAVTYDVEVVGYGQSSAYTLFSVDECTPDSDNPVFTYLSALYKTDGQKRAALTPRSDNVCANTVYYQTVDPRTEKDSLDKWLRAHGFLVDSAPAVTEQIDRDFLNTDVIQAEYQNMYDLGFGRDMYCKRSGQLTDSYPCIVQNYSVADDLTQAADRPAELVVSVAMEFLNSCEYNFFGIAHGDCGATAFYVFDNKGRRINSVDLDGSGRKSVPGTCLGCHDGEWNEGSRTASRGEYLPFDGSLFGHFERDSDTSFSFYSPFRSSASSDYTKLNKLLRPVLPGRGGVSSSSGVVAQPGIRRINGSGVDDTFHDNYGGFNAGEVLDTYCRTCHIAQVDGDYFIADRREDELGTNCQLCHNNQAGGGSRSVLEGHLCDSRTSATVMPNAKITHLALYNAALGRAPYADNDAKMFVENLCGSVSRMNQPAR